MCVCVCSLVWLNFFFVCSSRLVSSFAMVIWLQSTAAAAVAVVVEFMLMLACDNEQNRNWLCVVCVCEI